LILFNQVGLSLMFFPPACIGQQRVCSDGNCHCIPAPPRDLSSFETLNRIGIAMGQRQQYNPWINNPPSLTETDRMYQTSREVKMWESDFNRKYGLNRQ
jgi:hypothetical protein